VASTLVSPGGGASAGRALESPTVRMPCRRESESKLLPPNSNPKGASAAAGVGPRTDVTAGPNTATTATRARVMLWRKGPPTPSSASRPTIRPTLVPRSPEQHDKPGPALLQEQPSIGCKRPATGSLRTSSANWARSVRSQRPWLLMDEREPHASHLVGGPLDVDRGQPPVSQIAYRAAASRYVSIVRGVTFAAGRWRPDESMQGSMSPTIGAVRFPGTAPEPPAIRCGARHNEDWILTS
jgi:hypothetical protein